MKKIILFLLTIIVLAGATVVSAQDERTAKTSGGFNLPLRDGERVFFHLPGSNSSGAVFLVVHDGGRCVVLEYFPLWTLYAYIEMTPGQVIAETSRMPRLYCNPYWWLLEVSSTSKTAWLERYIPSIRRPNQPYNPQLTPYP